MSLGRSIIAFAIFGALLGLYSAGALPQSITQHDIVLNVFFLMSGLWALYEVLPVVTGGNWG